MRGRQKGGAGSAAPHKPVQPFAKNLDLQILAAPHRLLFIITFAY